VSYARRQSDVGTCFLVSAFSFVQMSLLRDPVRSGFSPPPLTTESPTTHTTDQHHVVPMDPRAAELMPIHAARLALTRSVTQKP